MASPVPIEAIEQHKENIEPIGLGRSAAALAKTFSSVSTSTSTSASVSEARTQFEQLIAASDELDDPLEPFLRYIQWTTETYPQGNSVDSGLVYLLEKCTSRFRDTPFYKDDPRYLRVWLQYARYSDNPRDIFVYLAHKRIGSGLATYYEEYANLLESLGRNAQADEVFRLGIEAEARPAARLRRRYAEFCTRRAAAPGRDGPTSPAVPTRTALAGTDGTAGGVVARTQRTGRKLQVFTDGAAGAETAGGTATWDELGAMAVRRKENLLAARAWQGETMDTAADGSRNREKLMVFRDQPGAPLPPVYSTVTVAGKKPEKFSVNLGLLYRNGEEFSLEEVYAKMRGSTVCGADRGADARVSSSENSAFRGSAAPSAASVVPPASSAPPVHPAPSTFPMASAVPLKDAPPRGLSPEPTMTLCTKAATDEVFSMFNQPIQQNPFHDSDSDSDSDSDADLPRRDGPREDNTSFYNDYTTATVASVAPVAPVGPVGPVPNTAPQNALNPIAESLRTSLLQALDPPLHSYAGFHSYSSSVSQLDNLNKSSALKHGTAGSKTPTIEFPGTKELFCFRRELGRGGYASVFLAERSDGKLKALKVEKPAAAWEFYIVAQLAQRLGPAAREQRSIIGMDALHLFADESYLVLDYADQGTVLDIVNLFRVNQKQGVEETLAVFFCIELLRAVEALHRCEILHGDLKPDNVMVRFDKTTSWSADYERTGSGGWEAKGVKLIDFGRAIDMSLLKGRGPFVCTWRTDQQDCPEMRQGRPYTYECDYYGLAGILHTLLFGSYIQVTEDAQNPGKYKLVQPFKRYWQQHMWAPLFDVLINSRSYLQPGEEFPITHLLERHRMEFEDWLEMHCCDKGESLKQLILAVEEKVARKK